MSLGHDKACYLLPSQNASIHFFATPGISYMVFLAIALYWVWEREQSLGALEEKVTLESKDL